MSAKIKYTDEPLGKPKVVPDFFRPPKIWCSGTKE